MHKSIPQNSAISDAIFQPLFTGKEKDSETGYYYFGARYYNSDLSLWLSVDPMADKYPSLSPYNYCAWNPMKLIDPDGKWPRKGVNIYTFNAKAGIGVACGFDAGWKHGIATDHRGMTQFSAVSTMYITNQNLDNGNQNPEVVAGFNIGISLGYERNHAYNTFMEAMQSSSVEVSIEGKGLVGGSVGIGSDSFSGVLELGFPLVLHRSNMKSNNQSRFLKKRQKK